MVEHEIDDDRDDREQQVRAVASWLRGGVARARPKSLLLRRCFLRRCFLNAVGTDFEGVIRFSLADG
jgi:hypothetical protein